MFFLTFSEAWIVLIYVIEHLNLLRFSRQALIKFRILTHELKSFWCIALQFDRAHEL